MPASTDAKTVAQAIVDRKEHIETLKATKNPCAQFEPRATIDSVWEKLEKRLAFPFGIAACSAAEALAVAIASTDLLAASSAVHQGMQDTSSNAAASSAAKLAASSAAKPAASSLEDIPSAKASNELAAASSAAISSAAPQSPRQLKQSE